MEKSSRQNWNILFVTPPPPLILFSHQVSNLEICISGKSAISGEQFYHFKRFDISIFSGFFCYFISQSILDIPTYFECLVVVFVFGKHKVQPRSGAVHPMLVELVAQLSPFVCFIQLVINFPNIFKSSITFLEERRFSKHAESLTQSLRCTTTLRILAGPFPL